jgi:hypothetical protein
MVLWIYFLSTCAVLKFVCLSFELQVEENPSELFNAFRLVIEKLTKNKVSTIHLIKPGKSFDSEVKVNRLLSGLKLTTLEISTFESSLRKSLKNSLAIFWLQDEMAVKRTITNKNLMNFTDSKMFLVFVEDKIESCVLADIFETFLALAILDVNVIMFDEKNVVLVTFVPFQDGNCRNTVPVIINIYNETYRKWNANVIFPKKLINLQKCSLKISSLEYPPALMKKKLSDGSFHFYGSDVEVINELSSSMNFTVDLAFVAEPYNFGKITENYSSGALIPVANSKADLLMGFYFLSHEKFQHLSHSSP